MSAEEQLVLGIALDESIQGIVPGLVAEPARARIAVIDARRCDAVVEIRALRDAGHGFPILLLAAEGQDLTAALREGANDYLRAPIRAEVLTERLRTQIQSQVIRGRLRLQDCVVDFDRQLVIREDGDKPLSKTEATLLAYLATRPGQTLDKKHLLRDVWGYRPDVNTRTLPVTMRRLRLKVEADPNTPVHLMTTYGKGYRFEPLSTPEAVPAEPALLPSGDGLVGRTEALAALDGSLGEHRLVTLLGPGGVGKTRLVRHYADAKGSRFGGGYLFIDLADCHRAEQMVFRLARVLEIDTKGASSDAALLERVVASLEARGSVLVILDNLEQLVHCAAEVVPPLLGASHARFVVTSRIPLGVTEERELPLEPLSEAEAVALFVHRARVARPSFALDERSDALCRQIVEQVDRLPLAIELVAARAAVLPLEELLRLVSTHLAIASDAGAVNERHASLTKAMAWSWELLSPAEQHLLAALSVFRGGFDFAAVRAVTSAETVPLMDGLQALERASLVTVAPVTARLSLLHTIRAFAGERLQDPGAPLRHAQWAAELADWALERLDGPEDAEGIERLTAEALNLHGAYRWSVAEHPQLAGRIAVGLSAMYWRRGVLSHAEEVLTAVPVELLAQMAPAVCARVLRFRAELSSTRRSGLGELIDRAVELAEQAGDPVLTGQMLARRGVLLKWQSRLDEAQEAFVGAIEILRGAGATTALGIATGDLGTLLHHRGDLEGAKEQFRAALILLADQGADRQHAIAEGQLAMVLRRAGEYAEAEARVRSAVDRMRAGGDENNEIILLGNLANLLLERGAVSEAKELLLGVLERGRLRGHRRSEAHTMLTLGAVHTHSREWEEAERMLSEAAHIMRQVKYPRAELYCTVHLGRVRHCRGDTRGALEYYAKAFALCTDRGLTAPDGLFLLHAAALADAGEVEAAKASVDRVNEEGAPPRITRALALVRPFLDGSVDSAEQRRRLAGHWVGGLAT